MKSFAVIAAMSLASVAFCVGAADKDTRGGTCDDAKQQYEYYCGGKGDPNDIFTQANIACNNAKRNMAAGCEGLSEADYKYEFNKSGTPQK